MLNGIHRQTASIVLISLILAVCFGISGCESTEPLDPNFFCYSNTEWNMTTNEVMTALELSKDDCIILIDDSSSAVTHYLFATDVLDFYEKDTTSVFEFRQEKGSEFGLYRVYVLFSDNNVLTSVRSKLEKQLGESKDDNISSRLPEANGHIGYWDGEEAILPYWEEAYTANNQAMPSAMVQLYKETPATQLYWTDNSDYYFDLINYQYQDVIRNACGSKGMLVFLGEVAIPLQYTADGLSK